MIKKTNFAASIDESRGVITGVLFEMKENSFNMVALDGFRMAVARENINNDREQNIIVPARTLNEVQKIISELFFLFTYSLTKGNKCAIINTLRNPYNIQS